MPSFLTAIQTLSTADMVILPCDGPLLPENLVERLVRARDSEDAEIAVAHNAERLQPIYALIHKHLSASLQRYLDDGDRKIDLWYKKHRVAYADFSDLPRTFLNINTPKKRDNLRERMSTL
ncbi:MAG: NTP transferase domain-containing protein [Candidatus Thiodiazotropha sp. (ex Lucinoma aequizonata)]|nr:NTP transferase domain-containing protein [Candidatus Thiodiazotropha sp. (ex Lucinoma aequizonata)]MCU7894973.1 NTP transferase domain-containing protein [Candidatus Thiodiazotropha sp. (ex Lucinoma aequizonata)]MCU7898885.1 NTP transferase domain-containing protein [Candidatus Thiodiazotropha sp. (ex Lucinoma aequizonata)]MCU7902523.1 NTP transferase domain-containing protein [Candidatus Thiodiazotropha sp. (ex Lucinoma aequizonata)]MCU7907889.1 NTP transferase domain-containing protein [C